MDITRVTLASIKGPVKGTYPALKIELTPEQRAKAGINAVYLKLVDEDMLTLDGAGIDFEPMLDSIAFKAGNVMPSKENQ